MTARLMLAAALLAFAAPASAQGAKASAAYDARVAALKPGQFIWDERVAPAGPMVLVVNIATQRAHAYRNGVRIGATTVSTGRPGKATPTGVFQILQKKVDHESNIYKGAKMPYMQRLTWDGIALHAGNLPGHPASAGCVRLPLEFSRLLYGATTMGMTVVIVDEPVTPRSVDDDALLSPFTPKGVRSRPEDRRLNDDENWRWQDEKAPAGPLTVVISAGSERAIVYRNGAEIGRARIGVPAGFDIGTRAMMLKRIDAAGEGEWVYLGLPGYEERRGQRVEPAAIARIAFPEPFARRLRAALTPGATVLATEGQVQRGGTGERRMVLESKP